VYCEETCSQHFADGGRGGGVEFHHASNFYFSLSALPFFVVVVICPIVLFSPLKWLLYAPLSSTDTVQVVHKVLLGVNGNYFS
jgi:hypothetical protein